jgi:hypothetical protein
LCSSTPTKFPTLSRGGEWSTWKRHAWEGRPLRPVNLQFARDMTGSPLGGLACEFLQSAPLSTTAAADPPFGREAVLSPISTQQHSFVRGINYADARPLRRAQISYRLHPREQHVQLQLRPAVQSAHAHATSNSATLSRVERPRKLATDVHSLHSDDVLTDVHCPPIHATKPSCALLPPPCCDAGRLRGAPSNLLVVRVSLSGRYQLRHGHEGIRA